MTTSSKPSGMPPSQGPEDGQRHHRRLERAIDRLERRLPATMAKSLRRLRVPSAVWVRAVVGGLLIIGGLFSFLPVLGLWMLPFGLILVAHDIPMLKRPVGRALVHGERLWRRWRRRLLVRRGC